MRAVIESLPGSKIREVANAGIGRDDVLAVCAATTDDLTGTAVELVHHRAVVAPDAVAVDTVTRYVAPDGEASTVASCDFYVITDGLITEIRSYAVDLG